MREQKSGYIINMSSMTGLVTAEYLLQLHEIRNEALTEGLAKEMQPFNIV